MFKFFSTKTKREKVIPYEEPINIQYHKLNIRSINSVLPETKEMRMPKIKII